MRIQGAPIMGDATPIDPVKARTTATYNAASEHFDDTPLSFWDRFGRSTVERLHLRPGATVLDVACGSGASALPAAERVGPSGTVVAVDLAERLLELGRAKAAARALDQIQFRSGDMEALGFPDGHFDAVICVFGIFFVADISRQVRELWRMVRPGGHLAITTWGPRIFEPATTIFWQAIQQVRPDLYRDFNPWDRITDPVALRQVLRDGGVARAEVVPEAAAVPLRTPEDWWTMVLGMGYRATVDQLAPADREWVRQVNLDWLRAHDVRAVETNVIYAVATKP
jgi:ubiquinone/menaquinone biosynthesis C-methylase UbiE